MIIRVRSKAGMWRLSEGLSGNSTIGDVAVLIEKTHHIGRNDQQFSCDAKFHQLLSPEQQLKKIGISHGDILYLQFEGDLSTEETGRKVNADGTLVSVPYTDRNSKTGFRPGLKSLRDMKMYWTIGEFMNLDAQFEFKMTAQKQPYCAGVHLNSKSCQDFQAYCRTFAFQQSRCGWLYGRRNKDDGTVFVECIYEPPQQGDPHGFEVFDDPHMERVEAVAAALQLEKVGWVFSHPPREDESFHFSSREVLLAAQLQMDAGGKGTDFVSLKVTLDEKNHASFEAFQVSDQCLDMFSSGALVENTENPKACFVSETFTAIVESKSVKEVDNNFFLTVVPVLAHDQPLLQCNFPALNREGSRRTREVLKQELSKYSTDKYVEGLSDFQLLIFLSDFLDIKTDIPVICQSILNPEIPLDEGFKILLQSVTGS